MKAEDLKRKIIEDERREAERLMNHWYERIIEAIEVGKGEFTFESAYVGDDHYDPTYTALRKNEGLHLLTSEPQLVTWLIRDGYNVEFGTKKRWFSNEPIIKVSVK